MNNVKHKRSANWGEELFHAKHRNTIQNFFNSISESLEVEIHMNINDNEAIRSSFKNQEKKSQTGRNRNAAHELNIFGLGKIDLYYNKDYASRNQQTSDQTKKNEQLFNSCTSMIKEFLLSTISEKITARSLLHEAVISLSAATGAAEYVTEKNKTREWLYVNQTREMFFKNIDTLCIQSRISTSLIANLLKYHSNNSIDQVVIKKSNSQFHLNNEITDLIDTWHRAARAKGLVISLQLKEEYITYGDPQLLRQMLSNIISNAIKYSYSSTSKSGQRFIEITGRIHDPGQREWRAAISFANYGVGILEDEIEHLGKPGFRGQLAKQEQPIGLGIGVFFAKEIAHLHGGEIKYTSKFLHDGAIHSNTQTIETATHHTRATIILPVEKTDQTNPGL